MADEKRLHPKLVGTRSEAMVLARLSQVYGDVLVPFGENHRYDFVIDDGERFFKVQCKTGRLHKGAIVFPTCSVTYHHPSNRGTRAYRQPYFGQVEFFGVYCPDTDGVYLVPVEIVGKRSGALRVEATLNGQAKKVRWAKDYEVRPG